MKLEGCVMADSLNTSWRPNADRINAGGMRISVGAVNVRGGNFVYSDTATHTGPEHIMASALPRGVAAEAPLPMFGAEEWVKPPLDLIEKSIA
jgi:hypothetical protein